MEDSKPELQARTSFHSDIIQKICNVSKLERKHSSGDLQSRLKTRKILGVGETDNGDIHRSKISQVLGHNEHLFIKFPRCYWIWHLTMAILCTTHGIMNVLTPSAKQGIPISTQHMADTAVLSIELANRLYGSAVLGFATLLWSFWGTTDKSLARGLIAAIVICQLTQFAAFCNYAWQAGTWDARINLQAFARVSIAVGNCYFFWAIGSSTAGLRKSASYKDLRERQPTPDEHLNAPCSSSPSSLQILDTKKTE